MKLLTKLIPVRKVSSRKTLEQFQGEDIEKAAKLILDANGIVNPLIVQRTGLDTYEVVSGDFEYFAASRAREIDLARAEMIQAFILEPENESSLMEQIKLLRENSSPPPIINIQTDKPELLGFQSLAQELKTEITNLLKAYIGNANPTSISSAQHANAIPSYFIQVQRDLEYLKDELKSLKSLLPSPPQKININLATEEELDEIEGITKDSAKLIISRRPFSSLNELSQISTKMAKNFKRYKWSQFLEV